MENNYTPPLEHVLETIAMLQALRDPTRPDHTLAVKSLDQHITNPSFVAIMIHIFSCGSHYHANGMTTDLRQLAGLVVKNYVFPHLAKLSPDIQAMLKTEIIRILQDELPDIRNTAATLAGKISETFPISMWGDMAVSIIELLETTLYTTKPYIVAGALCAIQRICEDSAYKLASDTTYPILDLLVPRLLALMSCNDSSLRANTLKTYNSLLYLLNTSSSATNSNTTTTTAGQATTQALILHMNEFMTILANLASDVDTAVRAAVCISITTISTSHVAVLEPYFSNICIFMLQALQDTEESVAIESCEFWAVMLETSDTKKAILPYLSVLIQHIIGRLYLTTEQMEQERQDDAEENSGEKTVNLRPIHHRNSSSHNSGNTGSSEEDELKEGAELSTRWTLRKQAALLLDTVAVSFDPRDVLSAALPKIQECFQQDAVLIRECGMLALGALSSGCLDEMAPHLPQLFPFLLQNVSDGLPEMRAISCWVLSRYCPLYASLYQQQQDDGGSNSSSTAVVAMSSREMYVQNLQVLIQAMLDPLPKVQIAACSAVSVLVENYFYVYNPTTGTQENILTVQLHALISAISRAFDMYGVKSSLILVDVIGSLADAVGAELRAAQYTALYLPQLMQRFDALEDTDMRMFPLLECLSSVLAVIGLEAQQYVLNIYKRSVRIAVHIFSVYSSAPSAEEDSEFELPSKDFAICALDVLSALCEGLGGMFHTLVRDAGTVEGLYQLIFAAVQDQLPELRQSGFSLAGEVCKHCIALVSPTVAAQLLQSAVPCLDTDFPLVCNNASWMIGELVLQVGGEFVQPYIPALMNALITALPSTELEDNVRANLAVTIGRLGMVDTLEVAALADEYFADLCSALELPCPCEERVQAFTGLLSVLRLNPNVLLNNKTNLYSFLTALSVWWLQDTDTLPADILQGCREILLAVQAHNPAVWNKVVGKFQLHYDWRSLLLTFQLPS